MSEFHSRDGFFFSRGRDGDVQVRVGARTDASHTVASTVLTASEWASVVAAVSARGETGETWREALDSHEALP